MAFGKPDETVRSVYDKIGEHAMGEIVKVVHEEENEERHWTFLDVDHIVDFEVKKSRREMEAEPIEELICFDFTL